MLLLFPLLKNGTLIGIGEVSPQILHAIIFIIERMFVFIFLIVFQYPVVLTRRLDLLLLLNCEIALFIEFIWPQVKVIRCIQTGRHQVQEVEVVVQEILLVWEATYLADVPFLSSKTLKDIVLIEESIVYHVRVHDVKLAVLDQDVVFLEVFPGGQFLSITIYLAILILDVIVILSRLFQAFVFIQELGWS